MTAYQKKNHGPPPHDVSNVWNKDHKINVYSWTHIRFLQYIKNLDYHLEMVSKGVIQLGVAISQENPRAFGKLPFLIYDKEHN